MKIFIIFLCFLLIVSVVSCVSGDAKAAAKQAYYATDEGMRNDMKDHAFRWTTGNAVAEMDETTEQDISKEITGQTTEESAEEGISIEDSKEDTTIIEQGKNYYQLFKIDLNEGSWSCEFPAEWVLEETFGGYRVSNGYEINGVRVVISEDLLDYQCFEYTDNFPQSEQEWINILNESTDKISGWYYNEVTNPNIFSVTTKSGFKAGVYIDEASDNAGGFLVKILFFAYDGKLVCSGCIQFIDPSLDENKVMTVVNHILETMEIKYY